MKPNQGMREEEGEGCRRNTLRSPLLDLKEDKNPSVMGLTRRIKTSTPPRWTTKNIAGGGVGLD